MEERSTPLRTPRGQDYRVPTPTRRGLSRPLHPLAGDFALPAPIDPGHRPGTPAGGSRAPRPRGQESLAPLGPSVRALPRHPRQGAALATRPVARPRWSAERRRDG